MADEDVRNFSKKELCDYLLDKGLLDAKEVYELEGKSSNFSYNNNRYDVNTLYVAYHVR